MNSKDREVNHGVIDSDIVALLAYKMAERSANVAGIYDEQHKADLAEANEKWLTRVLAEVNVLTSRTGAPLTFVNLIRSNKDLTDEHFIALRNRMPVINRVMVTMANAIRAGIVPNVPSNQVYDGTELCSVVDQLIESIGDTQGSFNDWYTSVSQKDEYINVYVLMCNLLVQTSLSLESAYSAMKLLERLNPLYNETIERDLLKRAEDNEKEMHAVAVNVSAILRGMGIEPGDTEALLRKFQA